MGCDTFTVSAKYEDQDTWFLLVISAIEAQLRLVGVKCLKKQIVMDKRLQIILSSEISIKVLWLLEVHKGGISPPMA